MKTRFLMNSDNFTKSGIKYFAIFLVLIGFVGYAFATHDPTQPYGHSIVLPTDVKYKTFVEFMEWCKPYYGEKCTELYEENHVSNMLPPLKQIKSGVQFHNVKCNDGLELVYKNDHKTSACVKLDTKIELTVRGWADDMRVLLGCVGERVQKCYPEDKDEYRKALQYYYYGTGSNPKQTGQELSDQKYPDCPVSYMKVSENATFKNSPPLSIEHIGKKVKTLQEAKSITGINRWSFPKYTPNCLELKQILVNDVQGNRKEILLLYSLNDIEIQSRTTIDEVQQHGLTISIVHEKSYSSKDWNDYVKNSQTPVTVFESKENPVTLTDRNSFQFSPTQVMTVIGNDRITLSSYIMDADEVKKIAISMIENEN